MAVKAGFYLVFGVWRKRRAFYRAQRKRLVGIRLSFCGPKLKRCNFAERHSEKLFAGKSIAKGCLPAGVFANSP